MADSPILVTGAAGFVGGHLLGLLEASGHRIVAWRRPGEVPPPPPTGTRSAWTEIDILDAAAVRAAIGAARPRFVYHLAGAAHAGESWERAALTLRVNVLGTHNLLEALTAIDEPVRLLIPGSALVYATQARALTETDPLAPGSPYGLSKLAQEMCATASPGTGRTEVVLTRSFNHIGPRQAPSFFTAGFARQIARIEQGLEEAVLRVGNLAVQRDLTDVRDTVRAYAALMERGRPGQVYNVCTGTAYRVGDIVDGLLARARVAVDVVPDPARFRPHDPAVVLGDRTRITADTGWVPTVAIDRTLDDLLEYWRNVVRDMSRV